MNINSTCLHELKPLIMALGLDVGRVSITGTYDVTNLKIGKLKHKILQIFKTDALLLRYLGYVQVKVLQKQGYVEKNTLIQYFSN